MIKAIPLRSNWRSEAVEVYNSHIKEFDDELKIPLDTLAQ